MPIDPWSICAYAVVLAVLGVVQGVLVVRGRLRRRRRVEVEGPRCAGCGYILYRGAQAVCPECGRVCAEDRFEAEGPARPVPPVAGILAGWVVLFPVVVGVAYPVAAWFPGVWRGQGHVTVATPFGGATVWGEVRGRGAEKRATVCDIRVPLRVDGVFYWVDLGAMTMRARGWGDSWPTVAVDREGLVKEYLDRGVPEADDGIVRAADGIVRAVRDLKEGRWEDGRFRYEVAGRYLVVPRSGAPAWFWVPGYAWACVPVWVGVGGLVTWWLVRRYRGAVGAYERAREAWYSRAAEACLPSPIGSDGG